MNNQSQPRVLDVGQCDFDHSKIGGVLEAAFGARVDRVHTADEAFEAASANTYDLVLVNRLLDRDRSEGAELIKHLQADAATSAIPVMLVSNFPEAQVAATAIGAKPGFGKNAIDEPATIDLLTPYLRR